MLSQINIEISRRLEANMQIWHLRGDLCEGRTTSIDSTRNYIKDRYHRETLRLRMKGKKKKIRIYNKNGELSIGRENNLSSFIKHADLSAIFQL